MATRAKVKTASVAAIAGSVRRMSTPSSAPTANANRL
jgi:hypothetical protein